MPRHETSSFSISFFNFTTARPSHRAGGRLAIIFGEISGSPARFFALPRRAIPDAETYGKPPTLRNLGILAQPAALRNGRILRFGASIAFEENRALEDSRGCGFPAPADVDSRPC